MARRIPEPEHEPRRVGVLQRDPELRELVRRCRRPADPTQLRVEERRSRVLDELIALDREAAGVDLPVRAECGAVEVVEEDRVSLIRDPAHLPGEEVDVVERTVRCPADEDHAAGLVLEIEAAEDGLAVEEQVADPAVHEIAVEVRTRVGTRESIPPVDEAAGHRSPGRAVRIREQRGRELRVGAVALAQRPAVVGAAGTEMDLLERVLPDVCDEDAARTGIGAQAKRIAEAARPDRVDVGASPIVERIVDRHRPVPFDADHLPARAGEVLRLRAFVLVAGRDVEGAIGPEVEAPADVSDASPGLVVLPDDELTREVPRVTEMRESGDPVPRSRGIGVIDVEEPVGLEVGIERDVDDAALIAGFDRGHPHVRRPRDRLLSRIRDEDLPVLLEDQDPAVRQEAQRDRFGDVLRDDLAHEARRRRGDRRARDEPDECEERDEREHEASDPGGHTAISIPLRRIRPAGRRAAPTARLHGRPCPGEGKAVLALPSEWRPRRFRLPPPQ